MATKSTSTSAGVSIPLPSVRGHLATPLWGYILQGLREQMGPKGFDPFEPIISDMTKERLAREAQAKEAQTTLEGVLSAQPNLPMLPVAEPLNPLVQALAVFGSGMGSMLTGNPQIRATTEGIMQQHEAGRQEATKENVLLSRQDIMRQRQERLQVALQNASRLQQRADAVGDAEAALKWGKEYERISGLLEKQVEVKVGQAKSQDELTRTEIQEQGELYRAWLSAQTRSGDGTKANEVTPEERTRLLQTGANPFIDKNGGTKNRPAAQSWFLNVPPSTGMTLQQWVTEVLSTRAGNKPLFKLGKDGRPSDAKERALINAMAARWFPDEIAKLSSSAGGGAEATPQATEPAANDEAARLAMDYKNTVDELTALRKERAGAKESLARAGGEQAPLGAARGSESKNYEDRKAMLLARIRTIEARARQLGVVLSDTEGLVIGGAEAHALRKK